MSRIERTNEKYNRALIKDILRRDKEPPEVVFTNHGEMMRWLEDAEEKLNG